MTTTSLDRASRAASLTTAASGVAALRAAVLGVAVLGAALLGLVPAGQPSAFAQGTFDASALDQSGDVFGGISFGGLTDAQQDPVSWTASYVTDGQRGRLDIEATVGRAWHIYSTTQPPGGPLATKFSIASPQTVSIAGKFKPDEPPTKSVSDVYPGVTIEEHEGVVRWSAPIKIPAGFQDPIKVDVNALVCQTSGSCLPANETLTATFAGPDKTSVEPGGDAAKSFVANPVAAETAAKLLAAPDAKPTTFRDGDYDVTWTAGVSSSVVAGERGQLVFRATPEADFHVYQGVVDDSESSTNFVVTEKSGLLVGSPKANQPIISKSLFPSIPGVPDTPPVKYYKGQVTWSLPIKVPAGTAPGDYPIQGYVCYQACTDKSCLRPMAFEFSAVVKVAAEADATLGPLEIKSAKFVTAIDQAAETKWVDDLDKVAEEPTAGQPGVNITAPDNAIPDAPATQPADPVAQTQPTENADPNAVATAGDIPKASLPFILLLALCGGFILNFMPCVLPVIGIKVLSFVQQAGEDRRRVALLNFAYVAGIMTVFAGLAVLAVVFSFGWGQQFAYFPVRMGLTVMIFALALSYLGVWELPTPGLATGKSSENLQSKEGLSGAFFTGTFATILATPCSGPFLGVALGYTIYLNSVESALVIMTVGLGMSLPYILLGLFPSLVGFLPKPGNWMVTLKEFLAFLFLGTVAYFFNQFSDEQKLAVFVTLIGVWFGCWVIGKVPPWQTIEKRLQGWTLGIASAVAIGWFGFAYLERNPAPTIGPGEVQYVADDHVRWEKFDEERLQEHQAAGRTVMLDFTAAWCPNCILNTQIALDTQPTSELLDELDAVPMLADMTDLPEDIVEKLEKEFGSKSIPLLAIYPGTAPEKPIVLRDIVTQSMVLDALKQAGPSMGASMASRSSGQAARLTSKPDPAVTSSH
ncbi:Thiol:disulfide interchange protein DsbD precursor [Stieleria neptunia]|uniref:Thiol:disulfide interchange protein DsbD n=1 Tax=Stieleria neptunia TaxID=2527979 RepID=A0A518HHW6_9BACT|nr:protein-disulfide reductase DsbD domain-containing protein [Stieleria neptunia]QDV40438.1 Thiol:disulfide interchange protein DsbD precursor [Stieleria neptunia]